MLKIKLVVAACCGLLCVSTVNAAKHELSLNAEAPKTMTLKGTGSYAAKTKVKAVASVKAGYAFGGWFRNDKLVCKSASYSFKMPTNDLALVAKSLPLKEDSVLVESDEFFRIGYKTSVSTEEGAYFLATGTTPFSLSAKGLPSGVSLVELSPCHYALKGKTKKKGVFYATLTAKTNGGYVHSAVIEFLVGVNEPKERNGFGFDFDDFEDIRTGERFSWNGRGDWGYMKVSGMPKGLKKKVENWGGSVSISGIPSKPGKAKLVFKGKRYIPKGCSDYREQSARSEKTFVVRDSGSRYVSLKPGDGSSAVANLSGGGMKRYGAKLKLTAKSRKKDYYFAGWYKDAECESPCKTLASDGEWRRPTQSVTLTTDWSTDVLYARFLTRAQDSLSCTEENRWDIELENDCNGRAVSSSVFDLEVVSETLPSVKAKSLPKGMSVSKGRLVVSNAAKLKPGRFTATLVISNLSGLKLTKKVTVVVSNRREAENIGAVSGLDFDVDGGYFYTCGKKVSQAVAAALGMGVSADYRLSSVKGLPKGMSYKNGKIVGTPSSTGYYTVTLTFKMKKRCACGSYHSCSATVTFRVVPVACAGSFVGGDDGGSNCVARVTVSSAGKVSGKVYWLKDVWTLKGALTSNADAYVAKVTATKSNGKTLTFDLDLDDDAVHCRYFSAYGISFWEKDSEFRVYASEFKDTTLVCGDGTSLAFAADGTVKAVCLGRNASSTLEYLTFDEGGWPVLTARFYFAAVKKTKTVAANPALIKVYTLLWNGALWQEWNASDENEEPED